MYGIYTYMKTIKNQPNVGKYAIHGSYGYLMFYFPCGLFVSFFGLYNKLLTNFWQFTVYKGKKLEIRKGNWK